jgi:hypothetical protein
MGNNINTSALQKLFDNFTKDINAKLDPLKEQLDTANTRLVNIEQGRQTDEAAAAAQLQRDREITSNKLEAAAKLPMETASRAFLKEQKEKASSQSIPEIVGALESKLFNVFKEAPEMNSPPPHLYQGALGSFPMLTPYIHKLSFPTYDAKEDPLPWINRCEQFFRGQKTPENDQVWYASYHLTGTAQQWYMRLTQDKVVTDWAYFVCCINERFGPSTWRNPLGKLASLCKTTTVDGYTERFLAHVARAGTLDEQQQMNIYSVGLLEPPKTDVKLQNPQDMEMTMSLARAYER